MKIAKNEMTKWREDPTLRRIRDKLYEVYQLCTCSNGIYWDADSHRRVYKAFNSFAWKLFNKKL